MKKWFAYLFAVTAMSFTLGLAAQDKQEPKKTDDQKVEEGKKRGDAEAQQYHEQQGQRDAEKAPKEDKKKDEKKDTTKDDKKKN
jgi:hypothetical protein